MFCAATRLRSDEKPALGVRVSRRFGLASAAILGLSVAGCQTLLPDPPAFETGILSSNEVNRLAREDLAAGNYGLAERHFRTAVERNKDDAPSWIGLAAAYDNLGRFELADRAYDQAIRLSGETVAILNNRGYSFLLRGDQKRALAQFERALARDPSNVVIRNNIQLLKSGERPTRKEPI